jgi:hypothetical protein
MLQDVKRASLFRDAGNLIARLASGQSDLDTKVKKFANLLIHLQVAGAVSKMRVRLQ